MGYSVGWDSDNDRWKGYGVPCTCEHPECSVSIDRGMDYLCESCSLAFCGAHKGARLCDRCQHVDEVGQLPEGVELFTAKPEHPDWLAHLRNDPSWEEWRKTSMARLEAWEQAAQRAAAHKGEQL